MNFADFYIFNISYVQIIQFFKHNNEICLSDEHKKTSIDQLFFASNMFL